MKQKFLLLIFMAVFPMAMMAYDAKVNGIYYNLYTASGQAFVTFKEAYVYNDYSGDVEIPESFELNGTLYTVTSIGERAFCNCTGLTSITIPSSVTSIGNNAFSNCSGLTSITVASGNTNYDSRNNCNAIIEKSSNTLIAGCKNTIIPNSVTSIGNNAFSNRSGLTSITIPSSVTSIGGRAFYYCTGLTSITIPNSVTSIGEEAFLGCSGLTSITIPNSVTSIGELAFSECTGLTSITVAPDNNIYDSRDNCIAIIETSTNTLITGCKNTTIPNSVTSIGYYAFAFTGLTSITIPNSVTSIGNSAFFGCSGLTSINIPNSVTSIGNMAFSMCTSLTSITIPNSLTSIEGYTFYGCAGLTSITIPSSVTKIGGRAFYYCTGLTSITIPNSVTSIWEEAFQGCSGLTSVTVENPNPVSMESSTFSNRANATLYVPRGSISAYQNARYWKDFKDIIEISDAPITVVISITAAGMGTYCSPYDLDFSTVTGLKAYIITGYDWQSKMVYATRVYDVPAGTGIYLVGAAADYTVPISSSTSYYINMLVGTLSDTEIEPTDGEYTNLRLTGTSPSNASFKFLEASRIIPANKAYLQIPTNVLGNSANAVGIIFDDETDGIESIEQNIDDNNDWFTLDGRKINGMPTTKGVYVVKGRKVVIK